MKSLRILHITNSLRADGTGITNLMVDLALSQARNGHQVAIACDQVDEQMRSMMAASQIRVHDGFVVTNLRTAAWSARHLRPLAGGYDVLHLHTVRAAGLSLLSSPRRHFRATVATVHNPYQRSALGMFTVRRIVSLSNADASRTRRRCLGLRRPRVIHNAILNSTRVARVGDVVPVDLGPHALVFVGAINERKGVDVLLRAMADVRASVPQAHLYLVGNRDNPEMEAHAVELGVQDAVTFVGFASDPRGYMKGARVFVLPARAEGFPLVLMEARSCGVPIVATRVGGIPEALDDGRAGLLVDAGDHVELALTLTNLLTDTALAQRMGLAAQRGIEALSVEKLVETYDAVYATLP